MKICINYIYVKKDIYLYNAMQCIFISKYIMQIMMPLFENKRLALLQNYVTENVAEKKTDEEKDVF